MDMLKAGFVDLKEHINANNEKNAQDAKSSVEELTKTVNKATKLMETPIRPTNGPLYSSVLKGKRKVLFTESRSKNSTPMSSKRKRNDDSDTELISIDKMAKPMSSVSIPKPKMGIRDAVIGLKPKPWVPKAPKRMDKSSFNIKNKYLLEVMSAKPDEGNEWNLEGAIANY